MCINAYFMLHAEDIYFSDIKKKVLRNIYIGYLANISKMTCKKYQISQNCGFKYLKLEIILISKIV